ncbi:MAG TPA: NADH-quinone oxidoreductase subunit I [Anaerolineales bacterium]|nr:NADH-quinone oxidoreductase subunit I [Anaerolineales bacterium]
MNGLGVIKGLGVTLKHFFMTYVDDFRWGRKRYYTPEGIAHRMSKDVQGITTVQYPEEKLPVPEEFRFVPFLVYETQEDGTNEYRCTSCGICAKVCPPQCIWIVRANDPNTGRPIPDPAEYAIDIDVCMGCGLCAEYCPFDAIKMDHNYELATYDRHKNNIYDKVKLGKPVAYYASIRPVNYAREEAARAEAEAARAARKRA